MDGNGGSSFLALARGAYWPIFQNEKKKVALVRPMPRQERQERDLKASYVPCLMSPSVLAPLCLKAGCKFNLEPCHVSKEDMQRLLPFGQGVYPEEYEIEDILDHKVISRGEILYLIKWKDWGSEFNTWEPRGNLEHSLKKLDAYELKGNEIKKMKRKYGEEFLPISERKRKIVEIIKDACSNNDIATLFRLSGKTLADYHSTKAEIKNLSTELLKAVTGMENMKTRKTNFTPLYDSIQYESDFTRIKEFAEERINVLNELNQWELTVNALPGVSAAVKIENHVDTEVPPKNFTYITDYKAANGIVISEDPPIGCECTDGCYENRKKCCSAQSNSYFAYNRTGTLVIPRGTAIYECNKRCSCGSDCPNRVVQKRPSIPLAIFRTDNGRGWGVKTLERIKKGTFVLEYVGEVITSEEAEVRGRIYDKEGIFFLFDLDFDGPNDYTVDATSYGNVAHFINHSCEPNLLVYPVWVNNLHPKLPRIAFFSKQDIRKGEELTFDYLMTANTTTDGEPSSPLHKINTSSRLGIPGLKPDDLTTPNKTIKQEQDPDNSDSANITKKRILCKCGAKQCRSFLFS